jgi:hypothetical protein
MTQSTTSARRAIIFGTLAAAMLGVAAARAAAPGGVTLFKVISVRDEILVGLTEAELSALASGPQAEAIAKKIAADGQMTVWQYQVRRGDGGALVMAPVAKVGIFAAGIVRIEPYTPAHQVVAPQ